MRYAATWCRLPRYVSVRVHDCKLGWDLPAGSLPALLTICKTLSSEQHPQKSITSPRKNPFRNSHHAIPRSEMVDNPRGAACSNINDASSRRAVCLMQTIPIPLKFDHRDFTRTIRCQEISEGVLQSAHLFDQGWIMYWVQQHCIVKSPRHRTPNFQCDADWKPAKIHVRRGPSVTWFWLRHFWRVTRTFAKEMEWREIEVWRALFFRDELKVGIIYSKSCCVWVVWC